MVNRLSRRLPHVTLALLLGGLVVAPLAPLAAREAPRLDPELARTEVTLAFDGATLREICDAFGLQVVFDDKVDVNERFEIALGAMPLASALDMLMLESGNFYKPLDGRTILVAPDSRQKRQEYEDQVVKTFDLENVDSKQVVTLLRSILQSRQIAESTGHNSITIKDTPDKVAIATDLIADADRAPGEVAVEFELIEVARERAVSVGEDAVALRDAPDTVVRARPTLRIVNGESGQILVGDSVPVPVGACDSEGGAAAPTSGFSLRNVGLSIQASPTINDDRDVTLDVSVEVSSLVPRDPDSDGCGPVVATRQLRSTMRLADGKTEVVSVLPAPGDSERAGKTEWVLLVTPRVTREPRRHPHDRPATWVGTSDHMRR